MKLQDLTWKQCEEILKLAEIHTPIESISFIKRNSSDNGVIEIKLSEDYVISIDSNCDIERYYEEDLVTICNQVEIFKYLNKIGLISL